MAALFLVPAAALRADPAAEVLHTWYRLVLELVRHTPTYSPPVASRTFGYLGVTAYEAVVSGRSDYTSLAGQLNGLAAVSGRDPALHYDEAAVLDAALGLAVRHFFANTGPTGQRAITAVAAQQQALLAARLPPEVIQASRAYGESLAAHIIAWSDTDGGAVIENMGFAFAYAPADRPGAWVPTSLIVQQQAPLLPEWGNNRPFAMPTGQACALPPPPAYDEAEGSAFRAEANEVFALTRDLTDEHMAIARFWSDDPMLSPTPPGHWLSIALQILTLQEPDAARSSEVLARLGIAVADAFIGCWSDKYRYDLLRPVTYIRRFIDPNWSPLLITPPFPEYPSGHSTQSGAAAVVLTAFFGEQAFVDATHADEGLPERSFVNFWAAADESALSRLYGGIHFRSAIRAGLDQGRCIGGYAATLRMSQ